MISHNIVSSRQHQIITTVFTIHGCLYEPLAITKLTKTCGLGTNRFIPLMQNALFQLLIIDFMPWTWRDNSGYLIMITMYMVIISGVWSVIKVVIAHGFGIVKHVPIVTKRLSQRIVPYIYNIFLGTIFYQVHLCFQFVWYNKETLYTSQRTVVFPLCCRTKI